MYARRMTADAPNTGPMTVAPMTVAIVHSTERQRYSEALKGSSSAMTQIVQEAIDNNLASVEKMLDKRESIGAIPIPR